MDWLEHYGIKGQRWGHRRFQNPDGSFTQEGKIRYGRTSKDKNFNNKFNKAVRDVKSHLSNKPDRIIKKPLDIEAVKERGNLTDSEAAECGKIALKIFDKSYMIEPRVTEDVTRSVEPGSSKLYGLENRLKQPTSLAAKIGSDAKENDISFAKAAGSIKDAIRYTAVSDEEHFVSNYETIKRQLANKGYTEVRCKNYFVLYESGKAKHKAVQSVFEDHYGNAFELQFQTYSSQAAKELKTPIYEERRKIGNDDKRKWELERQMRDLAECVDSPLYIEDIKTHG